MIKNKDIYISKATEKNWKRLGTKKTSGKLIKRANKSLSKKQFIPVEYLISSELIDLALFYQKKGYGVKEILYSFALNLTKSVKNSFLASEIKSWGVSDKSIIKDILEFPITYTGVDLLGGVYQTLMTEGEKNKKGSYYTPEPVVIDILSSYYKDGLKVLDPCCGSGSFLLLTKASDPTTLWGFDLDAIAVKLARINLIIKYSGIDFLPNIFCLDSLDKKNAEFESDFDLIITNPPWGSRAQKYDGYKIKSKEAFSLFLERSIEMLKNDGIMSFILPVSFLSVYAHRDIRKFILDYRILAIHELGRIFSGVFTPVIRIDISKTHNSGSIDIFSKINHKIEQKEFSDNPNHIFDIHSTSKDRKLFDKIFSKESIFLTDDNSSWALGIVTGNNSDTLSLSKKSGYIPIFTGKEVNAFRLSKSNRFIKLEPDGFQQIASKEIYESKPKLIYRFISRKLVFSLDTEGVYTLNSANIVKPKFDYPITTILALFNSDIYSEIFRKKFNSIKVLKKHLQALPLPLIDNDLHEKIKLLVNLVLLGDNSAIKKINEVVNNEIFSI